MKQVATGRVEDRAETATPQLRLADEEVRSACVRFANQLSRQEGREGAMSLLLHIAVVQAILGGVSRARFEQIAGVLWADSEIDLAIAERAVVMSQGGSA